MSRKWRPHQKCLYVIPEIHGNLRSLQVILDRILPFRFSEGLQDRLVLLGDYIGYGEKSAEVIDLLLALSRELKNDLVCLIGNHEQKMLDAFTSEDKFYAWINSPSGLITFQSYLNFRDIKGSPISYSLSRAQDIIGASHFNFLKSLSSHLKMEDFVFFHGSFDIMDPENTTDGHYINASLASTKFKYSSLEDKEKIFNTLTKTYVSAHNFQELPFISPKYIMLGGGAPSNLILFEMYSRTCAMLKNGKNHIYKHNFSELK